MTSTEEMDVLMMTSCSHQIFKIFSYRNHLFPHFSFFSDFYRSVSFPSTDLSQNKTFLDGIIFIVLKCLRLRLLILVLGFDCFWEFEPFQGSLAFWIVWTGTTFEIWGMLAWLYLRLFFLIFFARYRSLRHCSENIWFWLHDNSFIGFFYVFFDAF